MFFRAGLQNTACFESSGMLLLISMGKYNIKRYVRNDGIQGTPEDYSTIEMLNNNHNIMINVSQ
mgnify:CR=1 FL=1